MTARVTVLGDTHLAVTLHRAAQLRGFEAPALFAEAEVIIVAEDILEHSAAGMESMLAITRFLRDFPLAPAQTLVIASQLPPGMARKMLGFRCPIYYQVDTIIMSRALARAHAPEQFIVGCADPEAPLPLAYQEYLMAHGPCPIRQMSYESAEVAKLAINYVLSKQIEAACDIAAACDAVGADYSMVRAALHGDQRIGQAAYLRPGKTNQHLDRDIVTLQRLAADQRETERIMSGYPE